MRVTAVQPLKVAIIGLGRWGSTIAGVMQKIPELQLTACYARTGSTRNAFAQKFDCVATTTSDELFMRDDVDAVIVTVPNDQHSTLVIAAARAGKHVCVDKPIATTIADGRAMISACAEAGVKLAVGASARFLTASVCAKSSLTMVCSEILQWLRLASQMSVDCITIPITGTTIGRPAQVAPCCRQRSIRSITSIICSDRFDACLQNSGKSLLRLSCRTYVCCG